MTTAKLSEIYVNQANAMIKAADDAESLTDWDAVNALKAKAAIAEKSEQSEEFTYYKGLLEDLVEYVNVKQSTKLSLGYIGNCDLKGNDDREWSVFAPHPGRVGKATDRLGHHPTLELSSLYSLCSKYLADWSLDHKKANNY